MDQLQIFCSCVCLPVFFESPREEAREVIDNHETDNRNAAERGGVYGKPACWPSLRREPCF